MSGQKEPTCKLIEHLGGGKFSYRVECPVEWRRNDVVEFVEKSLPSVWKPREIAASSVNLTDDATRTKWAVTISLPHSGKSSGSGYFRPQLGRDAILFALVFLVLLAFTALCGLVGFLIGRSVQ
jgi:hypothetical protein